MKQKRRGPLAALACFISSEFHFHRQLTVLHLGGDAPAHLLGQGLGNGKPQPGGAVGILHGIKAGEQLLGVHSV